jgi:endonuclease YncB( thermonuclease family)
MLLRTTEIARVGLALFGVLLAGATAVGLSPVGCTREVGQALVGKQERPVLFRAVLASGPAWEPARVTRIIDGDTYEVLVAGSSVRVRLLGVDAPESGQPFGAQASDSARAMLQGRVVRLRRVSADLYGRTLGNLVLPSGTTRAAVRLDSLLVVRGWAWAFDPDHQRAQREAQQLAAQAGRRGLWKCGIDVAVPPKVWRGFNAQNKRRYMGSCAW